MDELNKLEIRRSEIRQRMNEISGLDDLSEGVIAEEEKLRDEYQKLEIRARAAKIAADLDDKQAKEAFQDDDKKGKELAELRQGVSLGKYLSAIADGRSPDGKEAELQKELGMGVEHDPPRCYRGPASFASDRETGRHGFAFGCGRNPTSDYPWCLCGWCSGVSRDQHAKRGSW